MKLSDGNMRIYANILKHELSLPNIVIKIQISVSETRRKMLSMRRRIIMNKVKQEVGHGEQIENYLRIFNGDNKIPSSGNFKINLHY